MDVRSLARTIIYQVFVFFMRMTMMTMTMMLIAVSVTVDFVNIFDDTDDQNPFVHGST